MRSPHFFLLSLFLLSSLLLPAQSLVINEFVASSDSVSNNPDDFGEYDDWAELYNGSTQAIDLSNYYLSDNYTELDKWQFPSGVSIAANGYLVIWTDKDDEQGDLHTSFKLDKEGEQLVLSNPQLEILDSISFGLQETNVAMARIPNGTGDFAPRAPTFNANNDLTSVRGIATRSDFQVYPNPARASLWIDFQQTHFSSAQQSAPLRLRNLLGQAVLTKTIPRLDAQTVIQLNTKTLAKGIYFLEIGDGNTLFQQKVILH